MSDDLKKEMIGIGLIGLFIFVMASLLSYHPLDPSFNTLSSGPVKNWCGRAGSYIGDAMMQLFGIMSYCLAAFALVFAVFYVRKKTPPHILLLSAGFLLLFLSLSALLQIFAGQLGLHAEGSLFIALPDLEAGLLDETFVIDTKLHLGKEVETLLEPVLIGLFGRGGSRQPRDRK